MFDIGWSEMAVILLVALIVIGPKDLPKLARTMGRWAAKGRAMTREFQTALEDMAREAELDKVKQEIEKAGRTNVGKTIEKTIDPTGELSRAFDPTPTAAKPAGGAKPGGGERPNGAPAAAAGEASPAEASPATAPAAAALPPEPSPAKTAPAKAAPANVSPVAASPAKAAPPKASPAKAPRAKAPSAKASPAKPAPAKPSEEGSRPKAPAAPRPRKAARATAPAEPN
jgi:sec-independent protein translocase protein TatB